MSKTGAEWRDGNEERRERPQERQALQQEQDGRLGQGHEPGAGESEVRPGYAFSSSSSSSSYQVSPRSAFHHDVRFSIPNSFDSSVILGVRVPGLSSQTQPAIAK